MRHVKRRGLAILAGIVLSCAAARADTLAVSGNLPFLDGTTASVSFDWNTVTGQVFNFNVTDGFAYIPVSVGIDTPGTNAIAYMGFTRPNEPPNPPFGPDYMQIDGELGPSLIYTLSREPMG